jgi:hypothetical protein
LIENNLRQLYQAKEYYFSETGDADSVKFVELNKSGYIRKSIVSHIFHNDSLELKRGWRYNLEYKSGEPIYARRYGNAAAGTGSILETIWYPAPPEGAVAQSGSGGNPQPPSTLSPKPPVVVQQPPVVSQPPPTIVPPPVVVAQPPLTSTTVSPDVIQPPTVIAQPPAVIAQPPTTTTVSPVVVQPSTTPATVNPAVNQGPAATNTRPANNPPGNQPNNNHAPGNSAHGHAQGHGNNKP